MCGPSNPLQQFKQQTQFDRTLQQDRLASRRAPTQGFRSANPEAGLLDPEFEAFQAGLPPSELPQFHPSQQRPPNFAGASQAPSWATDFQRMQISPPPTFQQQHVLQSTPANANWAQGFREQISQSGPSVRQSASSPQAFQYMARYGGMNGFQQNNFAQQNQAPLIQSKGKEAVTEQFDEAAFERAFNQASDALTAEAEAMETEAIPYERGASTGNYEEHTDQVGWEATDGGQVHADPANTQYMQQLSKDQDMLAQAQQEISNQQGQQSWPNLQRLESDPIAEEMLREDDSAMQIEEEQQDPEKQREDDDALALTAQELLEKVEHNKTDKFRNSQFLSLMRKLRDREVKVEGNDMVETSSVRSALNSSNSKSLPPPPPSTSHPDSAYVSGTATPEPHLLPPYEPQHRRSPRPEFDSHEEYGWGEEHEFDHWESPYR